jgi:hypothetical protein
VISEFDDEAVFDGYVRAASGSFFDSTEFVGS